MIDPKSKSLAPDYRDQTIMVYNNNRYPGNVMNAGSSQSRPFKTAYRVGFWRLKSIKKPTRNTNTTFF